jgi:hypothetical protein
MTRSWIGIGLLLALEAGIFGISELTPTATPAAAPSPLRQAIRRNTYELRRSQSTFSGPGFDFLLQRASDAQFVALGEEHNLREIPPFTSALFQALHERYGFDHLALETDPVMARMASAPPLRGNREALFALARRYPNAFTFDTDQEIEMIADSGAISGTRARPIWGLDQVFGALHILDRLLESAPTQDARERIHRLIEEARPYEVSRFQPDHRYLLDTPKNADFLRLREILRPPNDSETAFLVDQLLLSERVYQNWKTGAAGGTTGYESSREREENMKDLLLADYRRAEKADGGLPRALIKMGHWHLYEGIGPGQIPTLGNFVHEFAKSHGKTSLHVAFFVVGKPDEFRSIAKTPWLAPFAESVPADRSTVHDLEAIRGVTYTAAGRNLDPQLKRIIFGFDAAVFLTGAHPGTRNWATPADH